MTVHKPVRADHRWQEEGLRYSICTIVNRPSQYAEMVESFTSRGFDGPDCEFLYLDNTQANAFDGYTGNNMFLNVARGEFVILCHQDVVLIGDGRANLDAALDNLSRLDPNWAVCGNAGRDQSGGVAVRITDPHGIDQKVGDFPVKVQSLDENFMIVRRSANLALSRDLTGFHFCGTDICLIADVIGSNCYVIDFHLQHKSAGVMDNQFFVSQKNLTQKYRRAFRSRWVFTTCTDFFISGLPFLGNLVTSTVKTRLIANRLVELFKRFFRNMTA